MALKFLGVVLVVIICIVCPIHSEYSAENPHLYYDIAKFIQDAATRISTNKHLHKVVSDDGVSISEEFKGFTGENIYPGLIDGLQNNGSNNGSSKCSNDLSYVLENIQSMWALQMLDSFGKPERGIMQGNLRWMGEFDECVKVYAPSKANSSVGDFHGQYCNAEVSVHYHGRDIPISIGACLPDTCENKVLDEIMNITLQNLMPNSTNTTIKMTCNPGFKKLTTAAICVIFLISIFILLALIGSSITAYEYFSKMATSRRAASASGLAHPMTPPANGNIDRQSAHGDDNDVPAVGSTRKFKRLPIWVEEVNPFFNCFCIFTNGAKLLDTSNSEGQLPCLHGIRFLSLSWVIVCHTYAFVISYAREVPNILPMMDNWSSQILMNGFYSVDSFFLLSGFLLAYLFFEGAAKTNGKVPWVYFYVHRYIRLTPVYMIVLAFQTTIFPYLSTGPLWTPHDIEPNCAKNWWKNLLYINNFSGTKEMCVGWSWYLSNDMQFFVISPIFLIALWRSPPIGIATLAFFMNITTVVNFVIAYQYELIAGLGNIFSQPDPFKFMNGIWNEYFEMVYMKPYTRIGPYLVGIALAYYLYRRKQNNRGKNSLVVLSAGWLIASTVTLACMFGLYHRDMSILEMSFYNAFNRTCFALGLAWVIYVCLTGQGGFVNNILSYKIFIPLSRLTYCAYLVHPIVIYVYYNSLRSLIDFSHLLMVILYLGFLLIAYSFAFITSLLFESPVIRLDKLVRNMFGKK